MAINAGKSPNRRRDLNQQKYGLNEGDYHEPSHAKTAKF